MDRSQLEVQFDKVKPSYNRLCESLKDALMELLDDINVDFSVVETRIKSFDSFFNKIERKGYKDPFSDVTDICGLRIINYYSSDIGLIESIICEKFNVFDASNKEAEMDDDQFGYRSFHFIASLKADWLNETNYVGLGELKFEIQVRTILMHGWASISHKLSYKAQHDVPRKFRRDLFRISALIEMADEQFERLKLERKLYSESFTDVGGDGYVKFMPGNELSADSLQALLDFYFSDREVTESISFLVGSIISLNMNLTQFNSAVLLVLPYLKEIEQEYYQDQDDEGRWTQAGVARMVLDLTNDTYFERHNTSVIPNDLLGIVQRWRTKINNQLAG